MQWHPYLIFDGNCEEAFSFYAQTLGGKVVRLSHYGDAPSGSGTPTPTARTVPSPCAGTCMGMCCAICGAA